MPRAQISIIEGMRETADYDLVSTDAIERGHSEATDPLSHGAGAHPETQPATPLALPRVFVDRIENKSTRTRLVAVRSHRSPRSECSSE